MGDFQNLLFLFQVGLVLVLGLALGSFATALAYRIPRDLPWILDKPSKSGAARSACPQCHHTLSILDLVPIFSWLWNQGRCRHCAKPVSRLYPLTELSVMVMCLVFFLVNGPGYLSFLTLLAMPLLAALTVIDIQYKILPNQLVGLLGILGLLALLVRFLVQGEGLDVLTYQYILGAVSYAGLAWLLGLTMQFIMKKETLGMGDIKFFGVAGLWLGLSDFAFFCISGGLSGVILGLIWKKITGEEVFPFGPALILSFYGLLTFGSSQWL